MIELRCSNKILHGVLEPGVAIEVKCKSARCGAEPGVVVIHRISVITGEVLETKRFRAIETRGKESLDGRRIPPVRSA